MPVAKGDIMQKNIAFSKQYFFLGRDFYLIYG